MKRKNKHKIYKSIYDYWNSNREIGSVLDRSKSKARDQQSEAFEFYAQFGWDGCPYAVFEVIQHLRPNDPIDLHIRSFSRAVTNLKNEGYVIKLGKQAMIQGHRGKMVHTYEFNRAKFNPPKEQLEMF